MTYTLEQHLEVSVAMSLSSQRRQWTEVNTHTPSTVWFVTSCDVSAGLSSRQGASAISTAPNKTHSNNCPVAAGLLSPLGATAKSVIEETYSMSHTLACLSCRAITSSLAPDYRKVIHVFVTHILCFAFSLIPHDIPVSSQEQILRHSRGNATKVIFLITDGYSNGGDPRPVAAALRERGVEIFTLGIWQGNIRELHDMASQPKDQHCYLVHNFAEFEALARRALHEDLPTGSYIQEDLSRCSSLCEAGRDCCDLMASCKCGTHTGQYDCICEKGYYGKGLQHECTAGRRLQSLLSWLEEGRTQRGAATAIDDCFLCLSLTRPYNKVSWETLDCVMCSSLTVKAERKSVYSVLLETHHVWFVQCLHTPARIQVCPCLCPDVIEQNVSQAKESTPMLVLEVRVSRIQLVLDRHVRRTEN
ncbi:Sushi, von [Collichthys lucidus]|uniref:Sushi, von n=1 Tax=Collichthys lucidus TaxID=240159 RepID=A0A4U5VWA8_COLLU|nr:Sushi, von [Collichthys lucidus]